MLKNNKYTYVLSGVKLGVFLVFIAVFIFSCRRNDTIEGCSTQISFNAQVQPIIQQNCASPNCHGYGGAAPFNLITYQQIDSAVLNANLLLSIKHQTPYPMPRINPFLPEATQLPDSVIQLIECWINQGRQNN